MLFLCFRPVSVSQILAEIDLIPLALQRPDTFEDAINSLSTWWKRRTQNAENCTSRGLICIYLCFHDSSSLYLHLHLHHSSNERLGQDRHYSSLDDRTRIERLALGYRCVNQCNQHLSITIVLAVFAQSHQKYKLSRMRAGFVPKLQCPINAPDLPRAAHLARSVARSLTCLLQNTIRNGEVDQALAMQKAASSTRNRHPDTE